MIKTLVFGECDHEGDLDTYVWEVANSGGRIVGKRFNPRQKSAVFEIFVDNEQEFASFMDKLKTKDASFFLRNAK